MLSAIIQYVDSDGRVEIIDSYSEIIHV